MAKNNDVEDELNYEDSKEDGREKKFIQNNLYTYSKYILMEEYRMA